MKSPNLHIITHLNSVKRCGWRLMSMGHQFVNLAQNARISCIYLLLGFLGVIEEERIQIWVVVDYTEPVSSMGILWKQKGHHVSSVSGFQGCRRNQLLYSNGLSGFISMDSNCGVTKLEREQNMGIETKQHQVGKSHKLVEEDLGSLCIYSE